MSGVLIRPPQTADAADVARLVTQLGYASDAVQVKARLKHLEGHPDIQCRVAERDGQVVGMIGLMVFPAFHRDGMHGYVTALVVDEKLRGEGVGATLLVAAEAWFKERGAKRVNLTTALYREEAHGFYEKRGYTFTGKRYTKIL